MTPTTKALEGISQGEITSFMRRVHRSVSRASVEVGGGEEAVETSVSLGEHFELSKVRRLELEWRDLVYTVPVSQGRFKPSAEKHVLKNVFGEVKPGHLMAVMGPTGCGKSSLLNSLAGRLPKNGKLTGEILVNGAPRTSEFHKYSAYSLQDDALFANLTVRETFWVAAELRLPSKTTTEVKRQVVQSIIMAMGLTKAADTRVGNHLRRGVSGGERKRTNIAVELISNPALLFLDEPTSGLDSFQAQSVMEALLNLARGGRTIISVIHQPRSSIFHMFDQLCLLSEGEVMFLGQAHGAVDFFGAAGFPCPPQFNAADFLLDLISMDYRTGQAEEESRRRIKALAGYAVEAIPQLTEASSSAAAASSAASAPPPPLAAESPPSGGCWNHGYAVGFPKQLLVLFWRCWRQNWRNTVPNMILLIQAVFLAVLIGLIYSDLEKTQIGIQDRLGVLFFITINSCMGSMFSVMQSFPVEKVIISRERDAHSYSTAAYFLSKVITEIPFKCYSQIVNGSILYWIVGLNPLFDRFLFFLLTQCCLSLTSASMGLMVGSWAPTQEITFAIAPLLMIILMLYGGFYISLDSLPPGSKWVAYISPMNWGFVGFTQNDLMGLDGFTCDMQCVSAPNSSSPSSPIPIPSGMDLDCPQGMIIAERPGCLETGDEILTLRLDSTSYTKWEALLYMMLGAVGYLLVGYAGLVVTRSRYQSLDIKPAPENSRPEHEGLTKKKNKVHSAISTQKYCLDS